MKYKDYNAAYNYYIEAMKLKPDYVYPLYNIAHIIKAIDMPLDKFKIIIEKFFSGNLKDSYSIIADIFYKVGYYETALEYIGRCEKIGIVTENIMILKAKSLIRTDNFNECIKMSDISENSFYYVNFSMQKVLSAILMNKYEYAISIVNSFKKDNLSIYNKKLLNVYSELINLFTRKSTRILEQKENERDYINIILDVLDILFINNKIEEFEVAVNLLNLIDNKFALLYLGKLYNKYGYVNIARKQILRSINKFRIYDNEALEILRI